MNAVKTAQRSVISAWSVISTLGLESDVFAQRVTTLGPVAPVTPGTEWGPLPTNRAYLVPDFDPALALGRKGTRAMDRATGLTIATVKQLLGQTHQGLGCETGLVLGCTGSASSIMSFVRDSFIQSKPYFVDPARAPNTTMNSAAGRCAIWHGLHGPNATIAGGRASGLMTLHYAVRLQRAKRATAVLCGAVEEFSAERSWLEWHARTAEDSAPLGEGCVMVLLEPHGAPEEYGRTSLAEILAVEAAFCHEARDAAAMLAGCIRRALARSGTHPAEVHAVSVDSAEDRGAASEMLRLVWPDRVPRVLSTAPLFGDVGAAEGLFQLVLVLAVARHANPGAIAVLTCLDRDGTTGCAVLRLL